MSRTMKDSGIPWIGEIPSHWQICRIKNVANLYTGNSLNEKEKEYYSQSFEEDTIPYISTKDISRDIEKIEYESGLSIPVSDASFSVAPKCSVLLCVEGGSAGKKVGFTDRDVCFVNKLCCFNTSTVSRYLYYYIISPSFNEPFSLSIQGIIGGVSVSTIKNFIQLLPTPSEQQAIADFLDKKCSEIDELICLQEKIIEELKAYKQSVITEAVIKGLKPDVPMKDSGIEWMGKIPNTWSVKRLKFIGEGENGLTYSPSDLCGEEGTLVLRSSNIQGSKLVFEDNVYVSCAIPERLWVKKGDIIICSRNGSAALVGKCALVEEDISASFGAFMLRFRTPYFCRYVFYLLSGVISNYKQLFATTTINQLTLGTFNNLYAPFIDNLKEQQAIADYLDKKCSEIDNLISLKQGKIEYLKEYKKSIIYEYTTGKKEVNE